VIGAVSGGVDSSVAAVLLHRAIGARFHAIMVDNGCLRKVRYALPTPPLHPLPPAPCATPRDVTSSAPASLRVCASAGRGCRVRNTRLSPPSLSHLLPAACVCRTRRGRWCRG
jgi:hypothetical protein